MGEVGRWQTETTQMSSGRGEWGEKVGEGSVCVETRRGTERQIDRLQSTRWEGVDGKKLNGDDKAGCRWRGGGLYGLPKWQLT